MAMIWPSGSVVPMILMQLSEEGTEIAEKAAQSLIDALKDLGIDSAIWCRNCNYSRNVLAGVNFWGSITASVEYEQGVFHPGCLFDIISYRPGSFWCSADSI